MLFMPYTVQSTPTSSHIRLVLCWRLVSEEMKTRKLLEDEQTNTPNTFSYVPQKHVTSKKHITSMTVSQVSKEVSAILGKHGLSCLLHVQ